MKIKGTYSDLDISFDRNPMSNDVVIRRDEEAIKRSLRNLILFKRGDKPFHPEINSGVADLLFELADPIGVIELKTRISEMIRKYEPRVEEAMVEVIDNIERNEVKVTIHFTIRNTQRVYSMSMVLERLR